MHEFQLEFCIISHVYFDLKLNVQQDNRIVFTVPKLFYFLYLYFFIIIFMHLNLH